MPHCDYCQGTGTIPPASAFSLPMKCYRCAGTGQISWQDLRPGDHVCYFYDDKADLYKHVAKFFAEGLSRKERCVYAFDDKADFEQLDKALANAGVQVRKEHARGALCYLTKEETYLAGGKFNPEAVIDNWRGLLSSSLDEGYTGVRGVGEATWALKEPSHCHELINYELMVDLFFLNEQPRITGICAYPRKKFPDTVLDGARLSHRLIFQD